MISGSSADEQLRRPLSHKFVGRTETKYISLSRRAGVNRTKCCHHKIAEIYRFCLYRRPYLIWSSEIALQQLQRSRAYAISTRTIDVPQYLGLPIV